MKTLNQKKKELFELLVQYYETKPEESWSGCTNTYIDSRGRCCAVGHIKQDFKPIVERVIHRLLCITTVNDGGNSQYKQPTPKQRVLAYLKDEINKL